MSGLEQEITPSLRPDELRSGPQRPLAAIADEVATFGINPDQPQGKPWQEAIRLLRAA